MPITGGGGGAGGSIRAGRAHVELSAKDAGLERSLERARLKVLAFGKALAGVGGVLIGAGGGILAPLAVLFKETVGHFDKVQKAATRLGATAEDVSALGYAAEQSGSNLEELEKASRIMLATLAEAPETFDEFGLSAQKLKGLGLADKFEE